ncbi:MAG: hypothetical protein SO100_01620, partial [Dysosmobacter sp.]|nr:hypothetical protein [Dysosmobacter sp.]
MDVKLSPSVEFLSLVVLKKRSNSDLSIQSSKTIDFSRLHACFSFKPYLFALVFALTSRNKGNFLFPADHL